MTELDLVSTLLSPDDMVDEARREPTRIAALLAELASCPDAEAQEAAVRVAAVALDVALPMLAGWLDDEKRGPWAANLLHALVTWPEVGALPPLADDARRLLGAALRSSPSRELGLVCLIAGVEPERARDVVAEAVRIELDAGDAFGEGGMLDYDVGCGLQVVVAALRHAPLTEQVVELLDRVYPAADGPLRSACATSLIRIDAPPAILERWREVASRAEYPIEGYARARLIEVDTASAYARGASPEAITRQLAGRREANLFASLAVANCVRALAMDHPSEVEGALRGLLAAAEEDDAHWLTALIQAAEVDFS
ncbi:MAG: hypothetical protein KC731_13240 [Myxococcales bacterium]|nr:hypothetical protein [Myxococcales bacterium]